jgi:hypothetical protein
VQFGINLFTQMNFTERARYLGLRSQGKPKSQATLEYANFLRATARTSLASMEAAAERLYANAAEISASRRAIVAQDELPDWMSVLPAVKHQGSECHENIHCCFKINPRCLCFLHCQ